VGRRRRQQRRRADADLSMIVSEIYQGTKEPLRPLFDRASQDDAILFFDE
jgi:hypothetical protein